MKKRLNQNLKLIEIKNHIDALAVLLLGNRERWITVEQAVTSAREILDEVDRQVDLELEQSGGYTVGPGPGS